MTHLAELNIGRLLHPICDPRIAEFSDNLARINALAERMPGFVWRLKDDAGDATSFRISDDPTVNVNLSVWECAEALERYVFQTAHTAFYRKRAQWFAPMEGPHFVMWWVDAGHIPSLEEAAGRLAELAANGPTARAFGWSELKSAELWRAQRCA